MMEKEEEEEGIPKSYEACKRVARQRLTYKLHATEGRGWRKGGDWRALLGRASIAIANANARASAVAFARGHALFQSHSEPRNDQHFAPQ